MGWISDRHMKQGGSIGGRQNGRTYVKDNAPLKKIVSVMQAQADLFTPARVILECGHETYAWGAIKARCPECKKSR